MNVLLTAAGRRAYLVDYFREALGGRGSVVAADASWTAPALARADVAVTLPYASDASYIDQLLDLCKRENVGLVVPLNDLELSVLSLNKGHLQEAGIIPVVSNHSVIEMCFDKLATYEFCCSNEIDTATTFVDVEQAVSAVGDGRSFPLVIKPRWGSGSIGVEWVYSADELRLAYQLGKVRLSRTILAEASRKELDRSLLIQRPLMGSEYGLDVVNDLTGRTVAVYVKRKLSMRAGETDKAEVVDEPQIEAFGYRLGALVGHTGVLDCDVFFESSRISLLEMNPRFGGGYPFSHAAGANVPSLILSWAGLPAVSGDRMLKTNTSFAKFDQVLAVSKADWAPVD